MGKNLNGKEIGHGIIQKKDGRYEARYIDRFGKRKSISGSDLKDVKKRLNEAIYENEKEINIKDNIRLDDWYLKWMNVYKYEMIRENTKRCYNQLYYHHISPYLGNMFLKDITQLNIRELIKRLDKEGYGYQVKNKAKVLLVDIFNKAMIDEFVHKNPAKGIQVRHDESKEIRVLSDDNFFITAVTTGMRIGELAALRWKDIDLDNKIIHVRRTLVYQKYEDDECKTFHLELPKTKTSIRDIPINRQCETALKKQYIQKNVIADKAPDEKKVEKEFLDLLFTTKFNTPLNAQIISDAIDKIIKEINLMRDVTNEMDTFSCHCFRHTFATRCFEAGIQPKTVQNYLGHATLQMTMDLYTHVLKEHQISEMDKLENNLELINEKSESLIDQQFDDQHDKNKNIIRFAGDRMVAK